jgi:hypothetical protein
MDSSMNLSQRVVVVMRSVDLTVPRLLGQVMGRLLKHVSDPLAKAVVEAPAIAESATHRLHAVASDIIKANHHHNHHQIHQKLFNLNPPLIDALSLSGSSGVVRRRQRPGSGAVVGPAGRVEQPRPLAPR